MVVFFDLRFTYALSILRISIISIVLSILLYTVEMNVYLSIYI